MSSGWLAPFVVEGALLPWRFFQQPLFEFLLALDAVARPGHSLEALRVDFLPAVDAFAEAAFPDACQRSFHHLQELAVVVTLAKQKLFGIGTGRPVGNILGRIFVGRTAICLGTRYGAAQILLPCLQPLL